jgi:riboflavin synthase
MFSGLIAYRGVVHECRLLSGGGARLSLLAEGAQDERPAPKDSIAINGVCLTATVVEGNRIDFDVVPETLACSALGRVTFGERTNLEYSLRVGDRVGGHFVYGHVDAAAQVLSRTREGEGERVRIELPRALIGLIVRKAFVAVDGVSVTVATCADDWFEIALIPETLARTTLGERDAGSLVNLEADPLARYVRDALLERAPREMNA